MQSLFPVSVTFSTLTMSNVLCKSCSNFYFMFTANNFKISGANLNTVNGGTSSSYFVEETN